MFLLTGPNMAGKSTVARSAASCALLANCGLLAPISGVAKIPRFDGVFVRMAAQDAPSEGLSSFAVEVLDIKTILRDATNNSLVMIDGAFYVIVFYTSFSLYIFTICVFQSLVVGLSRTAVQALQGASLRL